MPFHPATIQDLPKAVPIAIAQLWPSLDPMATVAWVATALATDPAYQLFVNDDCTAGCGVKVYRQAEPPWLALSYEWVWWGHGREAVEALNVAKAWAKRQGATKFGYSKGTNYTVMYWEQL